MADYPTDRPHYRPFIFPRFGTFYLDEETAREMGFDPADKPTARGLRWFNWTIATCDMPSEQTYSRAAEFAEAVREANKPKVEPEVRRRKSRATDE